MVEVIDKQSTELVAIVLLDSIPLGETPLNNVGNFRVKLKGTQLHSLSRPSALAPPAFNEGAAPKRALTFALPPTEAFS
tara:strand:- start:1149 stop:1385 length:237 start_codon:yes stop_codon:yes gene_type:complete